MTYHSRVSNQQTLLVVLCIDKSFFSVLTFVMTLHRWRKRVAAVMIGSNRTKAKYCIIQYSNVRRLYKSSMIQRKLAVQISTSMINTFQFKSILSHSNNKLVQHDSAFFLLFLVNFYLCLTVGIFQPLFFFQWIKRTFFLFA